MRLLKFATLAVAMALSVAATPARSWLATVTVTPRGSHVIGNPRAAVRLTEFVSYTCPHCAHFQQQAETPMGLLFVAPGKLSIEVRHFVRDPVDLTVAMLANCGDPARFAKNHSVFLLSQEKWIAAYGRASAAQQARWSTGPGAARRRAIAADFGFYAMMEQRGYTRTASDRCLADEAMARRLAEQTAEARQLGVPGTPSFMIDDVLLAGTHDWASLQTQLAARF